MKNAYEVRGEVTAIAVFYRGQQYQCLIDTVDLELVASVPSTWFAWRPIPSKGPLYAQTAWRENHVRTIVTMHRMLCGEACVGLTVDHINHDGLNNRRGNLRCVSNEVNCVNRSGAYSNSQSGMRGLTLRKFKKGDSWRATFRGKHLGSFPTIELAQLAFNEAMKQYQEGIENGN